ncbi:MAG TPA: hypothetical protein VGA66_17825, partial [Mycobacterium sp.]
RSVTAVRAEGNTAPSLNTVNAEMSSDPAVPTHADAVNGRIEARHVLAHVFPLAVEHVSLCRATPKIQVVALFGVTAGAAVLSQWFDVLRFQVSCHFRALLNN